MTSVQAEFGSARIFTELNTVLSYALDAGECGCSVIPLKGGRNSVTGKQPRIAWQTYQTQHASSEQIEDWFRSGTSAYGIICGQISRLIVIDFDDPDAQAKFIQQFPHLMLPTSLNQVDEAHCISTLKLIFLCEQARFVAVT